MYGCTEGFSREQAGADAGLAARGKYDLGDSELKCGSGCFKLCLHTAMGNAIGDERAAIIEREPGKNVPVAAFHPRYIGEKEKLCSIPTGGAGNGHLIGIHVINVSLAISSYTGDDRQIAGIRENTEEPAIRIYRFADEAECGIELFSEG
jgi:hypothetical protein